MEIHRRSRDWSAHRHAQDPAYGQVVLHVVQVLDSPTLDADGRSVPTLQLAAAAPAEQAWTSCAEKPERGPPRPLPLHASSPCVRDAVAVRSVVEAAGRERFSAKAARFEGDLAAVDADQVVWHGLAEALGYRRNTRPFGQLAEAVPWAEAQPVVREHGAVALAGWLLGAAGLISRATLPEAHGWRRLQRQRGLRVSLERGSWDRTAVRAAAAPEQRCRGLAELAGRWAEAARQPGRHGLAEQVLAVVRQAAAERRPRLWPFAWAGPWIGRGRAQVIAINVLLPFAAAAGLSEAAQLFERLPGEPTNRIVRYMAEQLAAPGIRFRGACQQQGLLHLYNATCATRLCERCPALGQDVMAPLWLDSGP